MRTYNELKKQLLQNEEVKTEYERLEPEYKVIRAIVAARQEQHLTQQELADRTGIDRSDISKLENGSANPSLRTLKSLADGLGMQLQINFIHAN